jgi:GTP-binding protein Era
VRSDHGVQFVFVDTPGWQTRHRSRLNDRLNCAVRDALADVDAIVLVVDAARITDQDREVVELLPANVPVIVAVNKVDALDDKRALLPRIAEIAALRDFAAIVPVSAERGTDLEALARAIAAVLPEGPALYPDDDITDRDERFLAAEMVREQLMLRLDQELPYATTVEIEAFQDRPDGVAEVHAVIWVERDGQKAIVIGAQGAQLKAIGTSARKAMESMFERKVFLKLWVKVREGWADDENLLKRFGYE